MKKNRVTFYPNAISLKKKNKRVMVLERKDGKGFNISVDRIGINTSVHFEVKRAKICTNTFAVSHETLEDIYYLIKLWKQEKEI